MQNSLSNVASPARPDSQVESQLNQFSKVSADISSLIGELETRLAKVLRDGCDATGSDSASPEEYLVPHATSIRALRKVAEEHAARLQSLLNRLEA